MSYDKKCHKVHVLWTFCVNGLINVPGVTGDRVCGFPIGLRGVRCTTERSRIANVPGVSGDSVRHFSTWPSGASLLKTRLDFARTVESWEQAVESWASDM